MDFTTESSRLVFKEMQNQKNYNLTVDLYEWELLSLIPWEDNTLRVFENKGPRRIPVSEEEEAAGD
jgi:hypothetical protein